MQGNLEDQSLSYLGTFHSIEPNDPGFNGAFKQTKYKREAAKGLGITQMIIGISCLILNSILISLIPYFNVISYGIWGGILIFVAGLLQTLSAKKAENSCLIVGTMVMTVIAACASAVIFCFSVEEAVVMNALSSYLTLGPLSLGVIMIILALVEAVIAIITSAICCGFVCNKLSSMTPIPIYVVGNQSDTFQSNYPGMVLSTGQTITRAEQSSPQMTFYPYPQVSVNSRLSNNPPSTYENWNKMNLDIHNSHA